MPEPNRPPFTLAEDLPPSLEIKDVITRGTGLTIICDQCNRKVNWPNAFLKKRFKRRLTMTMKNVASRLRCGQCGSAWLAVVSYRDVYRDRRSL
jgi:hypothetical protein